MVPKKSRLLREGFDLRGYRPIKTPFFTLKVKDNGLKANRIGVIIGKHIDKRAVRRNFWKRQAKKELLKAPAMGKDLVLTIYPKTNTFTKREFVEEIKKVLQKI